MSLGDADLFQTARAESIRRLRSNDLLRLESKASSHAITKLLAGLSGVVLDEYVDSLKNQPDEVIYFF